MLHVVSCHRHILHLIFCGLPTQKYSATHKFVLVKYFSKRSVIELLQWTSFLIGLCFIHFNVTHFNAMRLIPSLWFSDAIVCCCSEVGIASSSSKHYAPTIATDLPSQVNVILNFLGIWNYLCRSWLQVVYPARWIPQKREAASMAASTIEPFFPSELDKRIQAHKKWPIYYNILACCYFYTFLLLALLKSLCSTSLAFIQNEVSK